MAARVQTPHRAFEALHEHALAGARRALADGKPVAPMLLVAHIDPIAYRLKALMPVQCPVEAMTSHAGIVAAWENPTFGTIEPAPNLLGVIFEAYRGSRDERAAADQVADEEKVPNCLVLRLYDGKHFAAAYARIVPPAGGKTARTLVPGTLQIEDVVLEGKSLPPAAGRPFRYT